MRRFLLRNGAVVREATESEAFYGPLYFNEAGAHGTQFDIISEVTDEVPDPELPSAA